jgi:hypothetical protein
MKQHFQYIQLYGLCLLLALVTACRKDEGSYSYRDINELKIENIPDEYEVKFGAKASLQPKLTFTKDGAEDHYTYEWLIVDPNITSSAKLRVVHTGKDLDVDLKLVEGKYTAYYTVTEKATGVTWQRNFRLAVAGAFIKKGWLVMSEVKGNTNISFLEEDMTRLGEYPVRHADFVGKIADRTTNTPLELKGAPRFLTTFANTVSTAEPTSKLWIYAGASEGCEKINVSNGFVWKAASYSFKYETANNYPVAPQWVFSPSGQMGYAYYNGELFKAYAAQREMFGVPTSRLATGEVYYVEPYMAIPRGNNMTALMYDRDNKRFLKHGGSNVNFVAPLPANPNGFDPNNLGMDLVWMGHTTAFGGQAVALLKNPGGQYFLARMQYSQQGAFSALSLAEITVPELKQGERFELEERYGYLIYNVGGKLYRYDMDTKVNTLVKDYGANAKVTLIKSGLNSALPPWTAVLNFPQSYNKTQLEPPILGVAVGVYDPANADTSGKLDVLDFSNPDVRTYYTLGGFGKVVDFDYINL